MAITALLALIAPLRGVLELSPLSPVHWLIAIGLSLMQLVFGELVKLIQK